MEIKQEDYLKQYTDEQRKAALKIALETRKFEIEMYWKRATYFWAFTATTFAGYFALLSSENIQTLRPYLILISFIGFMFSLGWYFVNRGSKFWQENWESHLSELEINEQGPLFSIIKTPQESFRNLKGHYPFSVSKVNQNLSFIITLVWAGIFIASLVSTLSSYSIIENLSCPWFLAVITGAIILAIIVLAIISKKFFKHSKSFAADKYANNSEFFLKKNIIKSSNMRDTIIMGNDEFILYIRKQNKSCSTSTKELGKKIWIWIESQDPTAKQVFEDMPCLWESSTNAKNIDPSILPKTATQFEFKRSLLPELYSYLDSL